jgi:hypothetical protein
MVDPHDHNPIPPSSAEPKGQRDFALHPATSARTRCIHRASASRTLLNTSNQFSKRAGGHSGPPLHRDLASATRAPFTKTPPSSTGGHSGPPLRGGCVVSLTFKTKQMDSAQRGGMLSGRAASRTGQLLDTASQHTFGGWQGGHHPRWQ